MEGLQSRCKYLGTRTIPMFAGNVHVTSVSKASVETAQLSQLNTSLPTDLFGADYAYVSGLSIFLPQDPALSPRLFRFAAFPSDQNPSLPRYMPCNDVSDVTENATCNKRKNMLQLAR